MRGREAYATRGRRGGGTLALPTCLLGDGWRPLSEYVYDRKYVYAAAVNHRQRHSIFLRPQRRVRDLGLVDAEPTRDPGAPLGHAVQPLPESSDPYNTLPNIFRPVEKPACPPALYGEDHSRETALRYLSRATHSHCLDCELRCNVLWRVCPLATANGV